MRKAINTDKKYVYCSYWGTWSRILRPKDDAGYTVEVNLTPISQGQLNWDSQVKGIRIRSHCTNTKPDTFTDELPENVLANMKKYLGEELCDRLLNEDFLSQIDWKLYKIKSSGGGGANLDDIKLIDHPLTVIPQPLDPIH